jgi:signal transduction histidine kinase
MTVREQILGRGLFVVFPDNPDEPGATGEHNLRASLARVIRNHTADAMPVQKYDVRRPAAEGGGFEERYWSPLNTPVLGPDGKLLHIIHRVEDVTEFVLNQAARTREEIATAFESHALQMEAEIYQRARQVAEANRQLSQANEALGAMYRQIELLLAGVNEAPLPDVSSAHIAPEEMPGRIGQLIANHKDLEEQLRQSQKMEAVGRLAGGVAHDFNNLLTVIAGYAGLLRESQPAGVPAPELAEIEKAVDRAASLTQKLLAFSRKQVRQPRAVDLNAVVRGLEELLRRLLGEKVQLATALAKDLQPVKADPHQIEQVVMNLGVNARDAMPAGGRLLIETRNVTVDGEPRALAPGRYALLSVSDNGHGMDAETARRAFEPFFTTKEPGKGTGLGLAVVFGIVEQSGGLVNLDTAPGRGASFRIYLPLAEAGDEQPAQHEPAAQAAPRRGAILLVEDEAALRDLVSTILSTAGHVVLAAASGKEALKLAAKQKPVDLILTDVVMPGMTGPELVARLRHGRPALQVLYMSGYDRELSDRKNPERNADFLPKPFTPGALLAKVAEVLSAEGRREAGGGESAAS